ncbi:MAG: PAS domain S-box protein [Promethearchaeota archaeon]
MTVKDKKLLDDKGISHQLNNILSFILESSNDICTIVNSKLQIEWINEISHERILGYTDMDLIGEKVTKFIHPEDLDYLAIELRDLRKANDGMVTLRIKTKNEVFKWMEFGFHLFKSKSGDFKFFLIGRDISERKNFERKLKESEEMYRLFMEKSHDFFLILGNEFNIENINQPNFQEVLGYSNEELLGRKIFDIIRPEYHKIAREILIKGSKAENKEIIIWDKKGHNIHIDIKSSIYKNSKGKKKILIAAHDISKRKETERKLISSERKNREAFERSEFYKDLFSHDINNILQTILSTAEISLLKIENEIKIEELKGLLKDIIRQVERGSSLVSNVQILSKIESDAPLLKKMEIIQVLKDAITFIKTSYPQDINIQIESHEPKYFTYTNELLLEVFENILINSIKHNDNKKINILIRISQEIINSNQFIRIEFHDNGRGIKDSMKKKVFSRYFSEDKTVNGMGLGLSLVQKIIKTYKGKIWVENKVKDDYTKGSKFIIILPEI